MKSNLVRYFIKLKLFFFKKLKALNRGNCVFQSNSEEFFLLN